MRTCYLLMVAFILSLLICEFIVAEAISYPKYGVAYYVNGLDYRSWDKSRIYKPFSRYMVAEGEFKGKVFSRNNYGFPGDDLLEIEESINIAVLGSSYIEAQQVPPSMIATSIAQQKLRALGYIRLIL